MTNLPSGWTEATVGDLFHYVRGVTYSKADATKIDEADRLPVLRANNFNRTFDLTELVFLPTELINKEQQLRAADLLFAMSSGSKSHVGKCILVKREMNAGFGAFCGVLRPLDKTFSELFYHAFQSKTFRNYIEELAAGTNINNLKRALLLDYKIPLPPLDEQRRIVEKIEAMFDEIEKGVESLQTAHTTLGLYRQSLLKSAFEGRLTADWRAQNADKLEAPKTLLARIQSERDARYKAALDDWQDALAQWRADGEKGKKPGKPKRLADIKPQHIPEEMCPNFPHQWGTTRFGNLNMTVSDGPFGSNLKTSDYTETGIRVIRLENIGYGEFLEEKRSFISEDKYETIKKHSIYPGTIMVSSFVTDAVRSCMVPKSIPLAINKADCFAAVLTGEHVITEFAAYYLQSPQVFDQVEDLVHGVGRPRINTTQLKELHFPVCSSAEQGEIVRRLDARLEAADALEAEIDAALTRASALRQSILKKAFSGQLVPQDPNDEPATALLERIKADRAKATKKTRKKAPA